MNCRRNQVATRFTCLPVPVPVEGYEELQPIGTECAIEIRESAATCSRKRFNMRESTPFTSSY
eukprot:1184237-Prorocentrum_minimum.AAC.3